MVTLRTATTDQVEAYLVDYYGYDQDIISQCTTDEWQDTIAERGDAKHFEEYSN